MNNINAFRRNQSGFLQVSVFAFDVGKPVSNASIRISQKGDYKAIREYELTDNSGQTLSIELDAPSEGYSLYQNADQKPYSEYDITVNAEGYEASVIEGVQIFPNTNALQNVFLNSTKNPSMTKIEEHTLWGQYPPKIPESAVKELPSSKPFVIQKGPVIPEYIVVHGGAPADTSAPNYWIPFNSYIKNVASCEIYPTWPKETLRANILAILSFTLNRVNTEWYRGKGYNFTITNSTAYDHAFSYGRNTFAQISQIVDEIFTTFITKPGISQPLFTQYCDGKRAKCPNWMSQWGSKDLGDKGYNAVDILKSYYGPDIYLMQAELVKGVPSSYPGTVLQMGSIGSDVKIIQEELNYISDHYPAIIKLKVDGLFGNNTRTAVEMFQKIFKLPTSGIVDFSTWYKISDVYVAVEKLSELQYSFD